MKFKFALLFVFCSLMLLVSCGWDGWLSDYQSFDYDLLGNWVTHDSDERYTGRLVITHDRITITGYGANQTPDRWGNDSQRPFRDFVKGVALQAYSENGHIFIEHAGILQAGIPYTYWDVFSQTDFRNIEFLTFEFGGRTETLRKEN